MRSEQILSIRYGIVNYAAYFFGCPRTLLVAGVASLFCPSLAPKENPRISPLPSKIQKPRLGDEHFPPPQLPVNNSQLLFLHPHFHPKPGTRCGEGGKALHFLRETCCLETLSLSDEWASREGDDGTLRLPFWSLRRHA